MELFWKGTALAVAASLLSLTLSSRREYAVVLVISALTAIGLAFTALLKPILSFLQELEKIGNWDIESYTLLMKAFGLGLCAEMASMVCEETGNASLGKVVQTLGTTGILYLSLPFFSMLLDLIRRILGEA